MKTSNALPAETLPLDKLCPIRVCKGTKYLQGLLTKNIWWPYTICHCSKQLSTLTHPPPTSKQQHCKNRLPGQLTELSESGHETTFAKQSWRITVKPKGEGRQAHLKLMPSQVWMVLLKYHSKTVLRQTRDHRGREMGCALNPKVYPHSMVAFPHVSSQEYVIKGYKDPPAMLWILAHGKPAQTTGREESVQKECTHLSRVVWSNA